MTLIADPRQMTHATAHAITGHISLVGAGPGALDLLTLRAVQRLADADAIYYDRLVDPAILSLANPKAVLCFVGKEVGAHAWTQDRICAEITATALAGKRVVRLKSGDPSVFGRAAEELEAARAHDIPVEIVPGITAASAAAASLTRPLTERGRARQVVFTSATGQSSGDPCVPNILLPATSYAIYMGIHRITQLAAELSSAGLSANTPVSVVASASCPQERVLECRLGDLASTVIRTKFPNPAIIFFTTPHALPRFP